MRHAGTSFAVAFALLSASGCVSGIDVGHDGQGGSAANTTTSSSSSASSGAGGQAPTGATCTSPGALLCAWGQPGGPCGTGTPDQDCSDGLVCVGSSAGVPGTCASTAQGVQPPGFPCGGGVYAPLVCPWNYVCNALIAPEAVGTCVPGNCVLSAPTALVSAASLTIDGDGPTQHDDFACAGPGFWGGQLTGEANASFTTLGAPVSSDWLSIIGCAGSDGATGGGSLNLAVQLTAAATVHTGQATYIPSPSAEDDVGQWVYYPGVEPMTVTVTELSADVVTGSYDVVVSYGPPGTGATKHLTGTFDVCRLPFHPTL